MSNQASLLKPLYFGRRHKSARRPTVFGASSQGADLSGCCGEGEVPFCCSTTKRNDSKLPSLHGSMWNGPVGRFFTY